MVVNWGELPLYGVERREFHALRWDVPKVFGLWVMLLCRVGCGIVCIRF